MSSPQAYRAPRARRSISTSTNTITPRGLCSSPPRLSLRNSNTFPDRVIQSNRLIRWLVAALTGFCFTNLAPALNSTKALSQYVHDSWGSDRGFLGGVVYAIGQSADGYLWIGTERGLVRF